MTKNEILELINQIYTTKRTEARSEYLERLNNALNTDDNFKKLYIEYNSLSTLIAKNKIEGIKSSSIDKEYQQISINFLNYIKEKKYDLNYHYSCNFCHDTGVYKNVSCKCKINLMAKLLKENSNLPKQANNINSCFNFNEKKVPQSKIMNSLYNKCEEWIDNFSTTKKSVFFIQGNVGIGKTNLAFYVANKALYKNYSVFYTTAFEANNIFIDKQFNKVNHKYNDLISADLLIIDDLGTEVMNTIGLEYLFNIIDNRINNNQKTMILTNLNLEMFSKKYGERSASRLTNKNYSIALDYIKGKDLRKI